MAFRGGEKGDDGQPTEDALVGAMFEADFMGAMIAWGTAWSKLKQGEQRAAARAAAARGHGRRRR